MARPRLVFSRFWVFLALILGYAVLIFLGDTFHLFESQELGFLDIRFRLRGARTPHPDIVVVEIDDQSIRRIGHWPWPRGYHATLLNVVSSYQPRLILYDVLFTEASTQPEEDQLLAYSIEKAKNVVLAFFFRSENPFVAFFPIEPFRKAAHVLGFVNIVPDGDGRIRKVQAFINPREGPYHHTSVATVLSRLPTEESRRNWLRQIPLDRRGFFWVNYPGGFSRFSRVPFHRIVEEQGVNDAELRRLLQGKIVVVGVTATGGGDLRSTPFSPAYPGVGIQASALHTLLTGQHLRRSEGVVSFGILLLLALVTSYLTSKNPPRLALVTVFLLNTFYLVWNFLMFSYLGWILPVFPVLLVIWGTYVLVLFLQYVEIRLEGELLTRELSLAARIQENFLPREAPHLEGLDVGFQCRFATMVGGDLYDWIPLGEKRLGICVGDVSGKGVPAALYMARVISEWRSLAKDFKSASELMQALNSRLVSSGMEGIFVTLIHLILDLDSRSILFSNAGHEPLLLCRNRTHRMEWVSTGRAQPLGLFPDVRYPEEAVTLEEGDLVVLISDGVKELRNPKGEELGLEGIERAMDSLPSRSAEDTVKALFRSMDAFRKGSSAHDDRTVVCIKMEGGRV